MKPIEILVHKDNEGLNFLTTEAQKKISFPIPGQVAQDRMDALGYLHEVSFSKYIIPETGLPANSFPAESSFNCFRYLMFYSEDILKLPLVFPKTIEEDKFFADIPMRCLLSINFRQQIIIRELVSPTGDNHKN